MPRKAMTKTALKAEEVKTEEVKQTVSKPTPKKFNPNDPVRCQSVTQGTLFVDGLATNMKYNFVEYGIEGDILYVLSRTAFNDAAGFHDANYINLIKVEL